MLDFFEDTATNDIHADQTDADYFSASTTVEIEDLEARIGQLAGGYPTAQSGEPVLSPQGSANLLLLNDIESDVPADGWLDKNGDGLFDIEDGDIWLTGGDHAEVDSSFDKNGNGSIDVGSEFIIWYCC